MLFLLFLTIFNWFFEILKWQILATSVKKISFFEALKQSLGALTVSLITPNRIGDYGAKAFYYKYSYRKRIVLINFIGNMMQMSVTILLGCIGFYLFVTTYNVEINYHRTSRFFLIVIIVSLLSLFGIKQNRFKIKGFSIDRVFDFIKNLPAKIKLSGFMLSVIRYAIFSFQFYFLLGVFKVDVSYFNAMVVITSMYLLASVIPSIFIFDVVIKGSVAVYLFTIVGVNEMTILCIVTLMWLLNFVLPSIFGSFYVLKYNLPKF